MERINRPRQLKKAIGKTDTVNDDRPPGAEPVPPSLLEKYGNKIGSVWWFAKGREDDPSIGVEIDGLRKTFGGYTWNEWWYFMKTVHEAETEDDKPQCYWYRKRKIPNPSNPDDYEIIEEYVGERLYDPDTGYDLEVPPEISHAEEDLCY
jgi:hypothetical protein